MAKEQIEIEVIMDDGSIKKGFATIKKEGEQSSDSLTNFFSSSYVKIAAGLATVGVALKKAVDSAIAGERITALNKKFEILAEREGIAASTLIEGLEKSAKGLISTTDLLETVNGAMTILGKNTAKLPEVLEIARKSASIFGGTALEKFEEITFAIEHGNQRALKNAGIDIGRLDDVYTRFALSIGKLPEKLDDAEKHTALLNAVLTKGKSQFAGLNEELTPVANAFKRFEVVLEEGANRKLQIFADIVGPAAIKILNSLTEALKQPTSFDDVAARIEFLKTKLAELQEKAVPKEGFWGGMSPGGSGLIKNEIASVTEELTRQLVVLDELGAKREASTENAKRNLSSIAGATDSAAVSISSAFKQISDGFENKTKVTDFAVAANKAFIDMGNTARTSFAQGVGGAFAAFGKSLAQGKNAFDDFGKFFIGVLGQILVQLGTGYILQGIAASANPLTPGIGGPLIAAGAALATFGGILQGLGGESGAAGANAAGGGVAGGGPEAPIGGGNLTPADIERQSPGTKIEVNIQGDVLDSDETGLRIVNLIQKNFDQQGTTIVGFA